MEMVIRKKKGFTLLEVVIALAVFAFLIGGLLGFLPWGVEGVGQIKDQSVAYGLVDSVQVELERMGFNLVESATNRLSDMYNPTSDPQEATDVSQVLLVARRIGGAVAFEHVVKKADIDFLNSSEMEEGEIIEDFTKDNGGVVDFMFSSQDEEIPVCLTAFEDDHITFADQSDPDILPFDPKPGLPGRWIPPEERYFLIKCTQFPLGHRHQHHPSNGFLSLQVDIQWPYKIPDPSRDEGFRRVAEKYRRHFRIPMAIVR